MALTILNSMLNPGAKMGAARVLYHRNFWNNIITILFS
jgi:hypothetical protein